METEQQWEALPPMSTKRQWCAAAAVSQKVFVFGGRDGSGNVLSSAESYDVRTSRWTSVRSMRTKRSCCAAAAVGDRIFVCGGYGNGWTERLSSVEAFDVASGTRSSVSPMTTKRAGCSAAVLEGRLCVCGGEDDIGNARWDGRGNDGRGNALSTVECYDPQSEAWSSLPSSMTTERFRCAAAVVGGRLIVCGGQDGRFNRLSSVEAYNARSRTWASLPSMSTKRYGCSATVVGDHLFVCGRHGPATVEEYDEQSGRWTPVPSMAAKRFGCATASVEGRLFVVGGYDRMNRLASAEAYDTLAAEIKKTGKVPDKYLESDLTGPLCPDALVAVNKLGRNSLSVLFSFVQEKHPAVLSNCK